MFISISSDTVKTKDVLLRKYDAIILKGHESECGGHHRHNHHNDGSGASSSLIANIVVTTGLLLISMFACFVV